MLSDRFVLTYRQMGLDRAKAAQLLHVSERTLHNWESGKHEIPYSAYKLLRMLSFTELPGQAWKGWHMSVGRLWSPEGHSFRPEDSNWWSALCRRSALFHVLYKENAKLRHEVAQAASQRSVFDLEALRVPVTRKVSAKSVINREIQNNNATDVHGRFDAGAPHGSLCREGGEAGMPDEGQNSITGSVTRNLSSTDGTNRENRYSVDFGSTCPVTRTLSPRSRKNCPAVVRYNIPNSLFTKTVKGGDHV